MADAIDLSDGEEEKAVLAGPRASPEELKRFDDAFAAEEGTFLSEARPQRYPGARGLGAPYTDDPPNVNLASDVPHQGDVEDDLEEFGEGGWTGMDVAIVGYMHEDADHRDRLPANPDWTGIDMKYALHLGVETPFGGTGSIDGWVLTWIDAFGHERVLRDDASLGSQGIANGTEMHFEKIPNSTSDRAKKYIRIVAVMDSRPPLAFQIRTIFPYDSLATLKGKIEDLAGRHGKRVPSKQQDISYDVLRHDDDTDMTLRHLGLRDDSFVRISLLPEAEVKGERPPSPKRFRTEKV